MRVPCTVFQGSTVVTLYDMTLQSKYLFFYTDSTLSLELGKGTY